MAGRFDGQVAIVTGGALGIGGATARRLASEGAKVLIADINDAAAAANVERIKAVGGTARAIHTDVAVARDIAHMVAEAVGAWSRLDMLVQNAFSVLGGAARIHGTAEQVAEADWDWVTYLRAADNVSGPLPPLAAWLHQPTISPLTCVFKPLSIPIDLSLSTRRLLSSRCSTAAFLRLSAAVATAAPESATPL